MQCRLVSEACCSVIRVQLQSVLIVVLTCVRSLSGSKVRVFAVSVRFHVVLDYVALVVCFKHVYLLSLFACSFVRLFFLVGMWPVAFCNVFLSVFSKSNTVLVRLFIIFHHHNAGSKQHS